jgi:hypothetical protein
MTMLTRFLSNQRLTKGLTNAKLFDYINGCSLGQRNMIAVRASLLRISSSVRCVIERN